tara:strand:+ start:894 stop:1508 length:615 start_codon:yes stop_codon:yes gene_type:complete
MEDLAKRRRLEGKPENMRLEVNPDKYICPISGNLMIDPVVAEDGFTYERKEMERRFASGHRTSPETNQPIGTALISIADTRSEIRSLVSSGELCLTYGEKANYWFSSAQIEREGSAAKIHCMKRAVSLGHLGAKTYVALKLLHSAAKAGDGTAKKCISALGRNDRAAAAVYKMFDLHTADRAVEADAHSRDAASRFHFEFSQVV